MALVYSEDQQMLRESAREFLAGRAPVSHLRALRDDPVPGGFSRELWAEMAELGWPGIAIAEVHGGLAFGQVGMNVLLQEIGRTLTPCPLLSSALIAAECLARGGSPEQQASILPGIADGSRIVALAHEEHAVHRPGDVAGRAERDGGHWAISAVKQAVIDGPGADTFLVSARDGEALRVFAVPAAADGVRVEPLVMLDAHPAARVHFEAVSVAEAARLAVPASDWLEAVLDRARIGQAGELLGVAETVFEMTLDYLRQRKQFGVAIGSFQALQHRAAHLYAEIELLRSSVLRAAQVAEGDDDEALALHASQAKAKASEVARLACNEAVQMHGGIGMTDEFDLGFYMKRARALAQTLGDEYFHYDRFARLRGY